MQDLNNNKFDLLIRAAVYDCHTDDVTMLEALDISSVKFDKAYLRRKKRILSEQKAINSYNHKKVVFNRIAITALIIISIIFGSIMSVSAVRESLWKTVTKWYDKYIDIYFNNYSYESSPPSEIEIVTPLTNNNTKPLQTKPRNDKINRGEKSNGTKKEAEIQSGI